MMLNEIQLNQPIFQALGWALLHFIWQGALVGLLYASLRVIMRHQTANARYVVACSAMLLMLVLPLATTLIIKRSIPQATSPMQEATSSTASISWKTDPAAAEVIRAKTDSATWTATPMPVQAATATAPTLRDRLATLMPWLVSVWLAGVLLLSLRVLGGWVLAQRLKNWKTVPVTSEWQETLERLAHSLRVSRPVRLCESIVAEVPTVIGWLRPVILVPVSAFVGLSPQQIEALLAHELAHIRRHDYLVNLLQTAVETLLFYHPAVWWVSREVRTEREHCCDDLAVAACGNVLTYARALAELEQLRGSSITPQLAVAADGGGASLLGRIQRLIGTPASPHQRSNAWLASLVAIFTIFSICVGARTTLFNNDAGRDESRPAEKSSIQQFKFGRTLFSAANSSSDESGAKSPMVLNGINESVTVVGSHMQEDEDAPAVAPAPPTPVIAPPLFAETLFTLPVIASPVIKPAVITQPLIVPLAARPPAPMAMVSPMQDEDDEDKPSSSYIDSLAAVGYTNLTVDQLISMRDHGVSAASIREIKALGYALPSVEMAIRLADHGVNSRFVKRLADLGYKKLSFDELIRAKDHGVNPETIEALNAAGYSNLSMEQLIRAMDHGVRPAYIKAMAEVGFNNLSLDQLIRLRDHGVNAEYIREIRSHGYTNVTAEQFIRLRSHGVTATFLRKAKERGFNNLSLEELIKLRDANIL